MDPLYSSEAERLVGTYSDLILRLSFTYLKSTADAEDVCQSVFLKLITQPRRFESAEHKKAWIVRAAVNVCKDELRAHRRGAAPLDAVAETAAPEVPESGVLDAVMALPEKYRTAVYLHYYEGYSIREIGGMTGRSEAAVTAHLSRGRAKLRDMLGGKLYEQGL